MQKHLKYLLSVLLLCCSTVASAQKLSVESFVTAPTDISASQYPRNDLNGHPCGLVKVQLAVAGAQFEGNVIQPVENKTGEYWVYMTEGSKELVVKTPSTLPLRVNFTDHQFTGIVPKTTYVLTLSSPQAGGSQKQQVSLRYSPANAIVLIDDQAYQSANGQLALSLPLGDHSYIVSLPGYDTVKGVLSLTGGSTKRLNVMLEPSDGSSFNTIQPTQLSTTPTISQSTPSSTASSKTFTVNGVTFKMIKVEGGTFQMGSNSRDSDEKPVHQVTLTNDYYIGETEVTQALWRAVMGSEPTAFGGWVDNLGLGDRYPAYRVSWDDCQTFINKLNALTGKTFRLPTEAEWEFAARGGTKSKGYTFSGSNTIGDVAWYRDNSGSQTHEVGLKAPNELGIYDMSGNVREWCQGWHGSYGSDAQTNPTGPTSGSRRVSRSGSWGDLEGGCRIAHRSEFSPSRTNYYLGLRLVL